MDNLLRRAGSFLVCSALVWVSPGLEAYAAEGVVLKLSVQTPVNPGKVSTIAGTQLSLKGIDASAGLNTAGLEVKTLEVPAGITGLDRSASNPNAQAGFAPQTLAGTQLQLNLQGAVTQTPAPKAAVISGALPVAEISPAKEHLVSAQAALDIAGRRVAPSLVGGGLRIERGLESLRHVFASKEVEKLGTASAGAPVEEGGKSVPEAKLEAAPAQAPPAEAKTAETPAPAQPASEGKKSSPWRNAYIFVAGLIVAQIGVEAWSAAWAKWVQTNFNVPGHDMYTTVTMVGMITSLVAGLAGGWLSDKFGLKRTIIGTLVLVAATAGATLALFQFHMLTAATPALLIGLVVARSFFNSANGTAEATMPIAIFKDDKAALQKFNSSSQFILEIAGIAVPYGIGALLGLFGFVGTMWIMPATLLAASAVLAFFLRVKEAKKDKNSPAAKDAPTDSGLLKIAMAGYPALVLLNYLLYAVIAIGYGNFLHPGASAAEQALASGVAGKIVSLYSAGGLIAAAILSGVPGMLWKWIAKKLRAQDGAPTTATPPTAPRPWYIRFLASLAAVPMIAVTYIIFTLTPAAVLPLWVKAAAGVAGAAMFLLPMLKLSSLRGLRSKWPWLDRKLTEATAEKPATAEDPHAEAKSAAKWLIFAAVGMAGLLPLLWTSPLLAMVAMIPFGVTNVMSTIQLISIAQSNTPQSKKGKTMGLVRTLSTALGTAGIYGFSKLFAHYPGSHFPFVIFAALGGVLAAYYVFTSIRLRRHIKTHETK